MPITVIVRLPIGSDGRLTFDGLQPVVIGRGGSCDVRLPDASVSHRHACIRADGADFVLVDEGSSNGTFVGQIRIAPHTSRLLRSGDLVRVGRVSLEVRIDQGPVTRDVAAATRDLALALVSEAMTALGRDLTTRVRVVEGADRGGTLALEREGRAYTLGRGDSCDLALSDRETSREHLCVVRRGKVVVVRALAAKNGTWIADSRVAENVEIVWRPAQMIRIGRTVLALEEPLSDALTRIEDAPDEGVAVGQMEYPPPPSIAASASSPTSAHPTASTANLPTTLAAGIAHVPPNASGVAAPQQRAGFSIADKAVMGAAIGVLALSIAGLIWLLRG